MKAQRRSHALLLALVTALAIALCALVAPHLTRAQQTSDARKPQASPAASPKAPPRTGGNDEQIIVNTDLINLTVTVTDQYGRYVSGLDKKAFTVFDGKEQQEISHFSDDDAPVSVGVIFDVSGSMSGDKIRKAREALSR
ncbi:MAG TPA: hypothetical protein VEQ40_06565, partial [Pyrinomonadaceae bacterium]|nr:hypothetical protein [Pyrinomonadaceae bacterium]